LEDSIHKEHRKRMKEKFLSQGAAAFTTHEMIEILLYFAIPQKDTNPLAHELENKFATFSALLEASDAELMQTPGMTPGAATLIRICGSIFREVQREKLQKVTVLDTTKKLGDYMMSFFIGIKTERVVLVCLDNLRRVLGGGVIAEGSVTAAQINTRQALQLALRHNATMVALAHNHPSGLAIPSQEDVSSTVALKNALEVADIRLIDHIVAADEDYVSMYDTPLYRPIFVPRN